MAAYAALVSLTKVIDLIFSQKKDYVHLCSIQQMMSLREKIIRLQDLLELISGKSHPSIDVLESRIRDAASQVEDIIEYAILSSQCENFSSSLPSAFGSCATEIDILLQEAMEMKENNLRDEDTSERNHFLMLAPTAKLDLKEIPVEIKDSIFRSGSKLQIIPITGMGGIGKTTLARAVYQHPKTLRHFDICSWVTVSQEFNVEEILRELLPAEQKHVSGKRLIECVHKRLKSRRYFIVIDDMWDEKAWDGVRNAFPDDNKGSRIILTTRLLDVAAYAGSSSSHIHEMQFLNDEQSWDLLQEKVGGYELWPKELKFLGRKISRNCRGLPLAIVAMAGLLKFNMTEEYWDRVARDTKSEMTANYDDHLLDILALSYTNLPPYLKPCFLYFGLFKEDEEIPTEELARLWTAEGFLKPRGSKEMEEVAEEYLEELVARSLVLVKKKRHDGRIKTCSLHDVLRDLSIRKARQEKFSQHITWSSSWMDMYSTNDLRRASIDLYCFTQELVHHIHVRSLRHHPHEEVMSVIVHFRLIRVLGKVGITENPQLGILYQLTNLRYLHIHLDSDREDRPAQIVSESISKLQNLETLIFSETWWPNLGYTLVLPAGMWEMQRLRHLILVEGSKLPCPAALSCKISCSGLHTVTKVTNFDLTRSMTEKLSNLKKLNLYYNFYILEDKSHVFPLSNLVQLHQLEELSIASDPDVKVTDLSFPHKLKKLSLKWTRMPVEKMSDIGSLPNLEVLKLKVDTFVGKKWEPTEGEFLQLKYLKMDMLMLKEWRAESDNFPQLETLIIKNCSGLKEVPAGIGEIDTLQKLVLHNCSNDAEESAQGIKREQDRLCNDLLQVTITRKKRSYE